MKTLPNEIVRKADSNYRTIAHQQHLAMAGFSMGGMQTLAVTPAQSETFSNAGIFRAGRLGLVDIELSPDLKNKVKLFSIDFGSLGRRAMSRENNIKT